MIGSDSIYTSYYKDNLIRLTEMTDFTTDTETHHNINTPSAPCRP